MSGSSAAPSLPYKLFLPDVNMSEVQTPVPPGETPDPLSRERVHSLVLHNDARAQVPVGGLIQNAQIQAAAQAHAEDMAANNYFSHYSQDGSTPFDRMRDAGVTFGWAGENLGKAWIGGGDTLPGIDVLFNMMMAEQPPNDGHRLNILNSHYNRVGFGIAVRDGWLYWVCDFAD